MAHRWPGNARELGNVLQRALVLREGERIEADDLHITPVPVRVEESVSAPVVVTAPTPWASSSATLHDVARASKLDRIRSVLDEVNGHRARAARQLGIRSDEHTSELQSLMRIPYDVFCLTSKNDTKSHKSTRR